MAQVSEATRARMVSERDYSRFQAQQLRDQAEALESSADDLDAIVIEMTTAQA